MLRFVLTPTLAPYPGRSSEVGQQVFENPRPEIAVLRD